MHRTFKEEKDSCMKRREISHAAYRVCVYVCFTLAGVSCAADPWEHQEGRLYVCMCVFMLCVVAPLGGNDFVPLGSGCLCLSPLAAQGKNRQYTERKKEQHHMANVL